MTNNNENKKKAKTILEAALIEIEKLGLTVVWRDRQTGEQGHISVQTCTPYCLKIVAHAEDKRGE